MLRHPKYHPFSTPWKIQIIYDLMLFVGPPNQCIPPLPPSTMRTTHPNGTLVLKSPTSAPLVKVTSLHGTGHFTWQRCARIDARGHPYVPCMEYIYLRCWLILKGNPCGLKYLPIHGNTLTFIVFMYR